MEDFRHHPAVCAVESEASQPSTDGSPAEKAETQEKTCAAGVDVPGVGCVHAGETPGAPQPEAEAGGQKLSELARLMSLCAELIGMGHAGVDLAMSNIVRRKASQGGFCRDVTECRECGAISDSTGAVTHNPICRTGRVLALACHFNVSANQGLEQGTPGSLLLAAKGVKQKIAANPATAQPGFGEPWTIVGFDATLQRVYIGTGSGIYAQVFELSGSFPAVLKSAHRLVNCVNASVGIADAVLLKATGAEHFLVRIVDRERFLHFAETWASMDSPFLADRGVQ